MKSTKKPVAQNYVYQKNHDKFTKKCKYCKQVIDKKESTPTDSNGRSAIVEKINSLSDSQLDKLSGYLDALIDK